MAISPIGRYQIEDSAGVGFDTSRGRSAVLWDNTLDKYSEDRTLGTIFTEDFTDARNHGAVATFNDGWFLSEAASPGATAEAFDTIVDAAGTVGVVSLSAGTGVGAHDGVEVIYGIGATTSIGTMALSNHATLGRGKVTYEIRMNVDDTDVFFVGHSDPSAAMLTAVSAPSATLDYIGFHRLTKTGDISFICSDGGTGGNASSVVVSTDAQLQTGYNKFGWSVDTDGKVILTRNGEYLQAVSESIAINTLPNIALARRLIIGNGAAATATVSLDVDWLDEHTSDAR